MSECCPHCGEELPVSDALNDQCQKVINMWNEIAGKNGLAKVRNVRSYGAKIRTLLKDERDMEVIRCAMIRFASHDLIRKNKYGLGNFLPNRMKWIEVGYEDAYRQKAKERGPSTAPGPITHEQLAEAAGLSVEQWREYHRIEADA